VQLLNYTDDLANIPLEFTATDREEDRQVFCEWKELRDLMVAANGKAANPVITPGKFVKTIHDVARIKGREIFTGWAQNDLPEFLLFMIECIHNSRKRSVNINIQGSNKLPADDLALRCYSMLKENYEKGDYSEISDVFYGVYVSRLCTPDGSATHSTKPEPYCILDLPIPHPSSRILSLYDCFDEFAADELLSGWVNENTKQPEPVRKNIVFWSFPKVLIITLKRYSPDGRYKNGTLVDFPVVDHLDLSKYVVGYKASTYKYALYGIANHMGSVSGGHYTAFAKNGEKWHCFDDAHVSEIDPKMVVSPSAYCLFYKRI
jgi:ubiquitin carboxyl-terminal hydrolase 8